MYQCKSWSMSHLIVLSLVELLWKTFWDDLALLDSLFARIEIKWVDSRYMFQTFDSFLRFSGIYSMVRHWQQEHTYFTDVRNRIHFVSTKVGKKISICKELCWTTTSTYPICCKTKLFGAAFRKFGQLKPKVAFNWFETAHFVKIMALLCYEIAQVYNLFYKQLIWGQKTMEATIVTSVICWKNENPICRKVLYDIGMSDSVFSASNSWTLI